MSKEKHTPEPWSVEDPRLEYPQNYKLWIRSESQPNFIGEVDLSDYSNEEIAMANANRIVACINACKDIPTENLEAGVIDELRGAAQKVIDNWERGDLSAAVRALNITLGKLSTPISEL